MTQKNFEEALFSFLLMDGSARLEAALRPLYLGLSTMPQRTPSGIKGSPSDPTGTAAGAGVLEATRARRRLPCLSARQLSSRFCACGKHATGAGESSIVNSVTT